MPWVNPPSQSESKTMAANSSHTRLEQASRAELPFRHPKRKAHTIKVGRWPPQSTSQLIRRGKGDDWGSFGSGETSSTIIGSSPARTEVKIRISKKQLKLLLGKGDSEEDIMARLIQIGGDWPEADSRTWTPALAYEVAEPCRRHLQPLLSSDYEKLWGKSLQGGSNGREDGEWGREAVESQGKER
ncbi:non-symbiotic hemoglobin 2 [Striga asiatica]|uniref:Non-symbiotic hemoglobin 2 n=1 Tax=Striga asiatica TaxID=4170 RepID=A0A5A7PLA9_STRAF|nr:non-symbiotic hemoglobin 2 [Striga asiatica]